MSPVFRHGRLRLYLLKLLDESPRHGYEVIRLLQDRFLGVYAPSPGTIYPRLARLEEDGLVTHEEVDGKKVYSITDKGREEIHNRISDLADLEDELTESLRDVAREISEDVRETVRGIREEITSAFRSQQATRAGESPDAMHARGTGDSVGPAGGSAHSEGAGTSGPGTSGTGTAGPGTAGTGTAGPGTAGTGTPRQGRRPEDETSADDEARRIREEARRTRDEMRAKFRARNRGDWGTWQDRFGRPDWAGWAPWSDSGTDDDAQDQVGRATSSGSRPGRGGASPFSDLERMAMQFANELRTAAKQAGNVGERSLSDLRDLLTDTLARVRDEVFSEGGPAASQSTGESGADTPRPTDKTEPHDSK
jgi:DNA-binding PadR family transcriptional regulator